MNSVAAVFSFPTTANQQPTAGPTDPNRRPNLAGPGAPPANELSPPPNGPDSVNGDGSACENDASNPVQEEQGTVGDGHTRTRDQREETGISFEDFVIKNTLL